MRAQSCRLTLVNPLQTQSPATMANHYPCQPGCLLCFISREEFRCQECIAWWMCDRHYNGYFDVGEDVIPGLPDDDDTGFPEEEEAEEDPEVEEEEEEEEDEEESEEGCGQWPTCEECGAEEETRPFPNKGWICIDCRYKSGYVEPAPEYAYAPSEGEPIDEAEPEVEKDPEEEEAEEGEEEEEDLEVEKGEDEEDNGGALTSEPGAKRRRR